VFGKEDGWRNGRGDTKVTSYLPAGDAGVDPRCTNVLARTGRRLRVRRRGSREKGVNLQELLIYAWEKAKESRGK